MSQEKKVRDVMTTNPVILEASQNAMEAAQAMRDHGIGTVLVRLDSDDGSLGLVTDRDLTVRALADGAEGLARPLREICATHPSTLQAEDSLDEAVQLMRERAVRRIPVMEGREMTGILSLGDLAVARDRRSVLGEISALPPNN